MKIILVIVSFVFTALACQVSDREAPDLVEGDRLTSLYDQHPRGSIVPSEVTQQVQLEFEWGKVVAGVDGRVTRSTANFLIRVTSLKDTEVRPLSVDMTIEVYRDQIQVAHLVKEELPFLAQNRRMRSVSASGVFPLVAGRSLYRLNGDQELQREEGQAWLDVEGDYDLVMKSEIHLSNGETQSISLGPFRLRRVLPG